MGPSGLIESGKLTLEGGWKGGWVEVRCFGNVFRFVYSLFIYLFIGANLKET